MFSYDLVPAPSVLEKALQACRRVNDYPTAMRVFEGKIILTTPDSDVNRHPLGIKVKVETPAQYKAYLGELHDIRKELGVELAEDLL